MKRNRILLPTLLLIVFSITLLSCGNSKSTNLPPVVSSQFAFLEATYGAGGNDSLVLMNNDGSGELVVENQTNAFGSVQEGYDGKRAVLAALDSTTNNMQVFYVDLTNQQSPVLTQLTTEATDHWGVAISWDGKTVAYTKEAGGLDQAALMSASGGTETVLSTTFNTDFLSFTPDGKILFVDWDDHTIGIMNADGSGVTKITTAVSGQWDSSPSASPDGKTITFTRVIGGSVLNIWTMNMDGSNQQQLTTDGKSVPSRYINNKIVFGSARDTNSNGQIYSMNPDGTDQKRLTTDSWDEYW
jgi:TolB protein